MGFFFLNLKNQRKFIVNLCVRDLLFVHFISFFQFFLSSCCRHQTNETQQLKRKEDIYKLCLVDINTIWVEQRAHFQHLYFSHFSTMTCRAFLPFVCHGNLRLLTLYCTRLANERRASCFRYPYYLHFMMKYTRERKPCDHFNSTSSLVDIVGFLYCYSKLSFVFMYSKKKNTKKRRTR
jgi:hypothetical protein